MKTEQEIQEDGIYVDIWKDGQRYCKLFRLKDYKQVMRMMYVFFECNNKTPGKTGKKTVTFNIDII